MYQTMWIVHVYMCSRACRVLTVVSYPEPPKYHVVLLHSPPSIYPDGSRTALCFNKCIGYLKILHTIPTIVCEVAMAEDRAKAEANGKAKVKHKKPKD